MQFKDLLRGTVLLIAAVATVLAAISAIAVSAAGDDLLAAIGFGWWLVAVGLGIWLGRAERAAEAVAHPLAGARTTTTLPSSNPTRIAIARLWPILAFAGLAGAAGVLWPQVPAIATGFALLVALAWRQREAAVTGVEDRDGVCFYVEPGSTFEPIKLVRTPGLRRDRIPEVQPPPPPPG